MRYTRAGVEGGGLRVVVGTVIGGVNWVLWREGREGKVGEVGVGAAVGGEDRGGGARERGR